MVLASEQFHTRLTRGFGPAQRYAYPTVSSFTFDRTGSTLCATISGYLPTLYELSDPEPLACFASPAPVAGAADGGPAPSSPSASTVSTEANDRTSLEGESDAPKRASTSARPDAGSHLLSFPRGYRNTTTTKHGSFGGGVDAAPGRGLYYAAGSDDFKAYVWEVPNLEHLREERRKRVAASAAAALQGRDSGQDGGGGIREFARVLLTFLRAMMRPLLFSLSLACKHSTDVENWTTIRLSMSSFRNLPASQASSI